MTKHHSFTLALGLSLVGCFFILRPVQSAPTLKASGYTAAGVFTVDTTADAVDANIGDGLCADSQNRCTLRAAIQESNFSVGTVDTIDFNITGAGTHTITPATPLPTITDPVTIDGYSQPGSSANTLLSGGDDAVLNVELRASSSFTGTALTISAGNSTVRGLVINTVFDSSASGIRLNGPNGSNHIEGNFIGTNVAGTTSVFVPVDVFVNGSPLNVIGGPAPAQRNLISGAQFNGAGITISGSGATGNDVQGNLIGTQKDGTRALGNSRVGVEILNVPNNTIGGTAGITTGGPCTGACNVIAFNGAAGVGVSGASATGNAVRGNSIFSNGNIGIDLGSDGVMPNDAGDADAGPNNLQNFPDITTAGILPNHHLLISYSVDSAPTNSNYSPGGLAVEFFKADANSQGKTFLGSAVYTLADYPGIVSADLGDAPTLGVTATDTIVATATDESGNTSEFHDPPIQVVPGPTAAPATISGKITTVDGTPLGGVLLMLSGTTSGPAITNSSGAYSFESLAAGGFYTVTPLLANYSFSPANRSLSLMANKTDAVFTATAEALATANSLDKAGFFVRQQYLDFLGREPDRDGFNYWSDQIDQCGTDAACMNSRRVGVSAAFFVENEFQQTGSFVYRMYQASLGRQPGYAEFSADRAKVTGAIGGSTLAGKQQAFADEWVSRDEFKHEYPDTLSAEEFVNRLFDMAGLQAFAERRQQIEAMTSNGQTRSAVLRDAIDVSEFKTREYNPSFVLMQYFGYLRRDPDQAGYEFWLNILNNSGGHEPNNYRGMVCSFITAAEYQQRFSPLVTRSSAECAN